MYRPERRGRQRHEELRVVDHVGADALATPDPGGHQVPGIGLVEAGARRADGRPAVLAGDEDGPFGELSRCPVELDAPEANRMGAQPGLVDLGED